MKKFKVLLLLSSWVVLAFAGACGSGSDNNPTQEELNQLFGDASGSIPAGTTCATSCSDIANDPTLQGFLGTFPCNPTGTFTVSVGSCVNGSIQITATFDQCTNGTDTVSGTATVTITVTSTENSVTVNASDFEANGFTFSTSNAAVTIPCNSGTAGAATCSGTVTAGSESCTLNSDCSGCTL